MIISIASIQSEHQVNISGIIHVGGNKGEEIPSYFEQGITTIVSFEPLPNPYIELQDRANQYNSEHNTNIKTYNVALGNENTEVEMYVSPAFTECSSVLKPQDVLVDYPDIIFNKRELVSLKKLDDYYEDCARCNFLNMDVQGYELEVLKGGTKTLQHIDTVYCEVNNKKLYENCALIEDIDEFLLEYNFKRKVVDWKGVGWGDALYIKETS